MADSLSLDEQALRHRLEQAAQHWQQSAAVQIQQLPARLDSLLVPDQQRFLDVAWGLEGQGTQPDVPVATYAQLYPELQEEAPEDAEVIDLVATPAPVPQERRRRFWHWFLKEAG